MSLNQGLYGLYLNTTANVWGPRETSPNKERWKSQMRKNLLITKILLLRKRFQLHFWRCPFFSLSSKQIWCLIDLNAFDLNEKKWKQHKDRQLQICGRLEGGKAYSEPHFHEVSVLSSLCNVGSDFFHVRCLTRKCNGLSFKRVAKEIHSFW